MPKSRKPTSASRISLSAPISIPLDKLELSEANVRRTHAAISIEALAESIARRSLLQSLSVRPILTEEGGASGRYAVQAGGRRLRALQLLVRQKRLAKDAPIPCLIKTAGIAEDDSLAENSDRETLHPIDQFKAFQTLQSRGLSEDDIAAAYNVTPAVVRQRLRLAAASPVLLEAFVREAMRLDHLMAFCLTEDHARQEQVWSMIESGQTSPHAYTIKRLLTEGKVAADDRRAEFVGLEAYTQAGGTISRDLFDEEDEGYFDDPSLLNALACEKLAAEQARLLSEGWKWAETTLESPYALRQRFRHIQPLSSDLPEEDQATYDALSEEYDALIETLDEEDENAEADRARLGAIEAKIQDFENRPPVYRAEDRARAGVILSISHEGALQIHYGYLKPEDETAQESAQDGEEVDADESDDASAEHEEEDAKLSPRLIHDLTAYRTAALQHRLAQDVDTALIAVLHALALSVFYRGSGQSCVQITATPYTSRNVPGLDDWTPVAETQVAHETWEARLPEHDDGLWDWLCAITPSDRSALLAYCASRTVKAVQEPQMSGFGRLQVSADRLAAALDLDMIAAGFVPDAENYFGRITKAQIIDAVREARGSSTAQLIDHLKKPDMAKEAARLTAGTGWLPAILRRREADGSDEDGAAESLDSGEPTALPAFLSEPLPDSEAA